MITRARRRGVTWLVYASPGAWQRERTVRFIVFRVYEKLTALLMRAYQVVRHPLRRHSRRLLRLSTQKRQVPGRSVTDWRGKVLSPLAHFVEGRFTRRFRDVLAEPFVPLVAPTDFVRDRIVLANASLAWGGAERQIVNTMTGLKQRGYTDLHLICEHLHSRPEHDFYLWHLQREGIPAHELRRVFSETIIGGDALVIRLARALDALPPNLADDILAFCAGIPRIKTARGARVAGRDQYQGRIRGGYSGGAGNCPQRSQYGALQLFLFHALYARGLHGLRR